MFPNDSLPKSMVIGFMIYKLMLVAGYWSFGAETCYSLGAGLMVIPLLLLILTKVEMPQQVEKKKN